MRRGLVAFFALSLVGLGAHRLRAVSFRAARALARAGRGGLPGAAAGPALRLYGPVARRSTGRASAAWIIPFKVSAFTSGSVGLKSKVTLACPIIPRIDTWLDEIVKPAADDVFRRAGRRHQGGFLFVPAAQQPARRQGLRARLRQRPRRDGLRPRRRPARSSVVKGWRGDPAEQEFLREAFVGACRYFTTVLGARLGPVPLRSSPSSISPGTIRAASGASASRSSSSRRASIPSGAEQVPSERAPPAILHPIDLEEDVPDGDAYDPGRAPPRRASLPCAAPRRRPRRAIPSGDRLRGRPAAVRMRRPASSPQPVAAFAGAAPAGQPPRRRRPTRRRRPMGAPAGAAR